MIRRLAATLVALTVICPVTARAQSDPCAPLADAAAITAAIRGPADRTAVQSGLRVFFGADSGFLADGIIGPVTLSFLQQLCTSVPLAEGTDPVAGTLDLARAYAALAAVDPGWPSRVADPGLLSVAPSPGFRRDVIRLAGTAATSAAALNGAGGADTCAPIAPGSFSLPPEDLAALGTGLGALFDADPELGPLPASAEGAGDLDPLAALAKVCAVYPAAGPAALADDMVRLGRLVAAVPDAAKDLGSPDFADWIAERQTRRLTRLLGSVPAVAALLTEYLDGGPPLASVSETAEAPVCPTPEQSGTPTYFSLEPADLQALTARAGIAAALEPVAAERFEDREALVAAIDAILGVSPPDCAALLVAAAVDRHLADSTFYSLDQEKMQGLALEPHLADLLPAVTPLQGLESGSRDLLATGIEAAIRAAIGKAVGAAAGEVADAAAAVAEDVSPAPDTPAPGIPPADPGERAEEFAITDTSLVLLKPAVPDQDFFDAITASPYHPVPSRELVRSDMLTALQPVVADRSDDLVRTGLAAILPNVRPHWRLAETVTAELAADPAFAAVDPAALEAIGHLSGIAYPTARLFDRGLASLPLPISGATRGAILDVALKRVADPYARRKIVPVAADCGCNTARRENSLVYGFYPFWQYDGADPALTPRVDFELVGRIAFDGLTIDHHGDLHYAAQWNDAAATFTVSAHRHQAAVDLGIRLVGWQGWSADQLRTAAGHVIEEMTRTRSTDGLVASAGSLGWLDPYLDPQPDGVTLIAEGYTGNPRTGGKADNLVALVRMISAETAGRGQAINLAFDIPLADDGTADDPLFQDLHGLIVDIENPDARLVRNVLVFVERRTTRSKKILRARVENSFKGEERIQVLRSIIPVVPPGANASLGQEQRAGDEVATATVEANSYGQFRDDVVYFQDNFAGIGFWPAPAAGAVLPDGSPDRVGEIVAARYYAWTPPLIPVGLRAPIRDGIDGACTLVCPNRLAFHLTGVAAAGLIGALLLLGLYSGRLRSLSRRLLLVPILMLGLLALLVVIVTCDASSRAWAPGAILAMALVMTGSVTFHWYERRVDGPMP